MDNISFRSLKKPWRQRKLRQTKCLLFNFWMVKLTKTPILPNWTSKVRLLLSKKYLFLHLTSPLALMSKFKVRKSTPTKSLYTSIPFIKLNIGIFTYSLIWRVQWRIHVNIHITRSHFTFVKRGNVGRKFWRKGGLVSSNDFHQIRHSIYIRRVSS